MADTFFRNRRCQLLTGLAVTRSICKINNKARFLSVFQRNVISQFIEKLCHKLCLIFNIKIHKFTNCFSSWMSAAFLLKGLPPIVSALVITTTQLHSKKLELGFRAG